MQAIRIDSHTYAFVQYKALRVVAKVHGSTTDNKVDHSLKVAGGIICSVQSQYFHWLDRLARLKPVLRQNRSIFIGACHKC